MVADPSVDPSVHLAPAAVAYVVLVFVASFELASVVAAVVAEASSNSAPLRFVVNLDLVEDFAN